MNTYRIDLAFNTDRPISETELDTLRSQLLAQIEEPVTADGDDVDYTTNLIEENKNMCKEYNGWSNRETWAAKLHLDNDEALNDYAWEYARQWEEAREEKSVYELGETLRNWIEEDLLTLENVAGNRDLWMMLSDIGSLYRVNWQEIAQTYAEELAQEEANA